MPGISAVTWTSLSVSVTSIFGAAGTCWRAGPKKLGNPNPLKASSKRRFISRRITRKGSVSSPHREIGVLRENGINDLLAIGFLLCSDLNTDGDSVFHLSDARSRPSHSFRLLAFGPGPHRASEDHLPFIGFDGDSICIDFRAATERFLD